MPTITAIPSPSAPNATSASSPNPQQSSKADARARAIAMLTSGAPSSQPAVPNQTNIPIEEFAAAKAAEKVQDDKVVEASETEVVADAPPTEAPKETKEEPISSQYAVLARKEKALRAKAQSQEASVRAREASIAQREEAIKAKEAEYSSNYIPKDRLTQDTWGTLQEAGITYDQLTQLALNPPAQQDPATKAAFARMEAEIRALRGEQENSKKSYQEAQTQQYQQAIKQLRSEAESLVKNDPNFETVAATSSVGDIVELIEETYKAEGVLLSVEEAAQAVEDHLVEEAIKIAKLKKIQQRLAPAAKKLEPQQTGTPDKQQQMKTLTNAVGTSRQLSAKERAILAFKGELRK